MKKCMRIKCFTCVSIILASIVSSAVNAQEALINLETTKDGIHGISIAELSAYGVMIEGQSADQLAITNQGVPVQIEVTGGAVLSSSSMIRFLAKKIDTLYTGTNVYTLSLNSENARRVTLDSSPIPKRVATATSYLRTATFSPQTRYSFTSPDTQDAFYAKRMVAVGKPLIESIPLQLEDVAIGGNSGKARAKLKVNVWGGTNLPGPTKDHSVRVSFNGAEVARSRFDGLVEQQMETSLEQVKQGSNMVRLTMPLDTGYTLDAINVNSVTVDYPSKFVAKGNRLDFKSAFRKFRISGFSPTSLSAGIDDLIVMREDSDGLASIQAKSVSCRVANCLVQLGGTGKLAHYYVSSKSALHKPVFSTLPIKRNIVNGNAKYLIISHPTLLDKPVTII